MFTLSPFCAPGSPFVSLQGKKNDFLSVQLNFLAR